MAQQADITVFDGASTPVSHTLKTDGVTRDGDVTMASWKEAIPTVPEYAQTRFTQMRQKLRSGVLKHTSRVEVFAMESISGQNSSGYTAPPKVAYSDRFELVSYAAPRSVETSRRLAMQMLLNLSTNVSTSVVAVSAGAVPELHQKNLIVS